MNGVRSESRETELAGVQALARDILFGGVAGLISGIVFLGFGARIVMRISAMLDPDMEGAFTENGNIVGEVTLGGTLELLFFVGLFGGMIAGVLWVTVREWLPDRPLLRVLAAGLVAALLGSFQVVSTENSDFLVLNPGVANVAMFVAVVGLTGSGAALLDGHIQGLLPAGRRAFAVSTVLLLLCAALILPLLVQAYLSEDFCGCQDPPRLALLFIAITGAATLARWAGRLYPSLEVPWLRPVATVGILGACVVAGLDLLAEVQEIT
jgi:hypothetical protein